MVVSALQTAWAGAQRAEQRFASASKEVARAFEGPTQAPLARSIVEQNLSAIAYRANLKTVQAADEMVGQLIHVIS
jgi:hypothetical protein